MDDVTSWESQGWGVVWSKEPKVEAPVSWYDHLREEITKCRDAQVTCKMAEKNLADGVKRADKVIKLSLDLERELLGGLPASKALREAKALRLQGMVGSLLVLWDPERVNSARSAAEDTDER